MTEHKKTISSLLDKTFLQSLLAGLAAAAIAGLPSLIFSKDGNWQLSAAIVLFAVVFGISATLHASILRFHDPELPVGERAPYRNLRWNLERGDRLSQSYDAGVNWLLERIARLCGDTNGSKLSDCFSAQSYDRMLLIGVIYPLLAMFVIWVFNGGMVGPAEAALAFEDELPGWRRAIALLSLLPVLGVSFLLARERSFGREPGWALVLSLGIAVFVAGVGSLAGVGAVAVDVAANVFMAVSAAVVVVGVRAPAGAYAVACAGFIFFLSTGVIAIAIAIALALAGAIATAVFGFGFGFGALADSLTTTIAFRQKTDGKFAALLSALVFLALLFAVPTIWGGGQEVALWGLAMILFLPLLTLANAPFDWLSLGVTRRLLHLNLEKRGWWAVLISLADLFFAMLMVALLSLSIVAVMQAFNASVVANGGATVFDPVPVVSAIADPTTRWEPQYWWIYATLLSTFIPSLFNLAIGAMSLLRGIRPLRLGLLAKLPEEGQIHAHDRLWLPAALGAQFPIAIALACCAIWVVFQIASFCFGMFEANVPDLVSAFAAQDYAGQFVRWIYS